jgi:AraC-like DNA-binding protein
MHQRPPEFEGNGMGTLHFSTRALPASKRLSALRQLFDTSVNLEVAADPEQVVAMTMYRSPGLRRAEMLSSFTARLSRGSSMLADGEDTVCLMINNSGRMAVTQRGHQGVAEPGDAVLLVYRETARVDFDASTYLSVRVPFSALAPLADVGCAAGHRITRDTEPLRLLKSYVSSLPSQMSDQPLNRIVATHIYDLIALSIGAMGVGRGLASDRSVRTARLESMKADLVSDTTVTLDQLAMRYRISPRSVQLLFEQAGTTFSEYVLAKKLDKARRLLISPRYAEWPISAIAYEAGFGDLSYFNRRFKQRYLSTPSEMRKETRD